jgi:hypothetical protein
MINPQKGVDLMNNTSMINRILFAVTLFQHTARYMGSPSQSSPMRVSSSSPTIRTHVDSQAISPFSPPRKTKSLKEIYETSMYANHNFALVSFADVESFSFNEACSNDLWMQAMEDEISQIEKNDTWVLVDLPHGKSIIGVKWIYKLKFNMDGRISKHESMFGCTWICSTRRH